MSKRTSQLFMWGFEGTSLSQNVKNILREFPPAGLILFKRNIESARQLKKLTAQIRQVCGKKILIGIDQEGGRVARLPKPFIQYPPAATWGELFKKLNKNNDLAYRIGRLMGQELREAGINLNFAPVLDINSNPKNPIIGDRAFSSDPRIVIQTALPFAKGLLKAGVIPCGKHFPGHGGTSLDSHKTLPIVSEPELETFQAAIRKKIPALMTAHVVYRSLDPKNPATLSRKIVTTLLRKKMGFKGVLFSDDLLMKGISKKYSPLDASIRSLEAGVDVLLICEQFEKWAPMIEKVGREIERSETLKRHLNESLKRLETLKKKA